MMIDFESAHVIEYSNLSFNLKVQKWPKLMKMIKIYEMNQDYQITFIRATDKVKYIHPIHIKLVKPKSEKENLIFFSFNTYIYMQLCCKSCYSLHSEECQHCIFFFLLKLLHKAFLDIVFLM